MSVVYRGRDTSLDREVAIKVLHPHLATRPESRARFSREARAVARLSHPGIVEIYDYSGDENQESWLVTEFVRGRTLRAFADDGGIPLPECGALVGLALSDALAHAHAAGVIHRDLKPENVMIAEFGGRPAVKLADFGIARILSQDDRMTMTGAMVGSPNHMAPEVVDGKEADERSDVFSLGTILYWLCTGRLPFEAPNPSATLHRLVTGDFPDPRSVNRALGEPLARLIASCLELDPAARPAGAAQVRDALAAILRDDGIDRPDETLTAFLADRRGTAEALRPRIVAARLRRGEEHLARGEVALALGSFDGVLAIEPRHPAVLARLAEVARSDRRRRLLRRGAVGLGVLVVAVLAVMGIARIPESVPVAAGGPAPALTAQPGPAAAAPAVQPEGRPVAEPGGRRLRDRSGRTGPGARPGRPFPAGARPQGARPRQLHGARAPLRPARPPRRRRGGRRRATGGLLAHAGGAPAPHRASLLRAVRSRDRRRLGAAARRAQGPPGAAPGDPAHRRGAGHPRLPGRKVPGFGRRLAARALPDPDALRRTEPLRG